MSQLFSPDTKNLPLSEKRRPIQWLDIKGQPHLTSDTSLLYKLVKSDSYRNLLFWGPPGTGKTSLARLMAKESNRTLHFLSATSCSVAEMRKILNASKDTFQAGASCHLLFLDEIHRLSKNQQDVLLPFLEDGSIKLIGATTENPSFEVNAAILSRCLVFDFKPISKEAMADIISAAVDSFNHEYGVSIQLKQDALDLLAAAGDGDGRQALNFLEAILLYYRDLAAQANGNSEAITAATLVELLPSQLQKYDKSGDMHYDTISALIKSVRASKPDAAVYYLARLLDAGEKPEFILRRLIILASEDIGNANSTALLITSAAMDSVKFIGMPESRIILSQVVTYLSLSPKSNRAYLAIDAALAEVRRSGSLPIPLYLRNPVTNLMKAKGYGKDYHYAHTHPEDSNKQSYLPEKLNTKQFYHPSSIGTEGKLRNKGTPN